MARWKPGQSGNPKGRRKGIIDKRQRMQKALGEGADAIIQVVKAAALSGDMKAADLVLARLVPTLKAEGSLVRFEFNPNAPLTDQFNALMHAISNGQLTVEEGQRVSEMLRARAEIAVLEGKGGDAEAVVRAFRQIAQAVSVQDQMGTPYQPPNEPPNGG